MCAGPRVRLESEFGTCSRWSIFRCVLLRHQTTLNLVLDPPLDLLQILAVHIDTILHLVLILNLGGLVTDVGQQLFKKQRKVRCQGIGLRNLEIDR